VSRVSRLCPVLRAQPGAYPPEAQKPALRRCARALAENARIGKNGSGKSRLRKMQENAENGQNREILDAAARKQEKAKVSCAHLGKHNCPQCGQFGALTQGLLRGQK
jgi:energy-coupling factor transporter ATP-binding protein EcfA2